MQNWSAFSTGLAGPYCAVWNDSNAGPSAQSWLIGAFSPGGSPFSRVYYVNGYDLTATDLEANNMGSSNALSAITVDNTGAVYAAIPNGSAGNTLNTFKCPAGGNFAGNSTNSFTNIVDCQLVTIGGNIIVAAIGATGGGNGTLVKINTGGVIVGVSGVTASRFYLVSNGTMAVALPFITTPFTVYTTTNGTSWTTITPGGIGGSEEAIGLAWSKVKRQWIAATFSGAGTKFYTSPDAANWTLTATLSTVTPANMEMTSLGDVWVAASRGGGNWQILYSYDAISWYKTSIFVPDSGTSRGLLAASPNQLFFGSGVVLGLGGDQNTRFSIASSYPDVLIT